MKNKAHHHLAALRGKHALPSAPLSLSDFYAICKAEGVNVVHLDMPNRGAMIQVPGQPVQIALRSDLSEHERIFVAFHELGHFLMHQADHPKHHKRKEAEADQFAALAAGFCL